MQETIEGGEIKLAEVECGYNITFFGKDSSKEVGRLYWDDGIMKFKGITEQSAQAFFDYLLDNLVNPYIEKKVKEK